MCEEVISGEVGKPGRGPGRESHALCDKTLDFILNITRSP